jgi:hypothetical protein
VRRRWRKLWRDLRIALGLAPIVLGGCAADPCSPRSAEALDRACAESVVEACRGEDDLCYDVGLAACDAQILAHAEECRR